MQRVAVCCSVLQCVALRAGPTHLGAATCAFQVWCSVVQCGAVCCGVLQRVAACCSVSQRAVAYYSALQRVAVCCSVLQCHTLTPSQQQRLIDTGLQLTKAKTQNMDPLSTTTSHRLDTRINFNTQLPNFNSQLPNFNAQLPRTPSASAHTSRLPSAHMKDSKARQVMGCNTLLHTATHCDALCRIVIQCNTVPCTATHFHHHTSKTPS